MSSDWPWLAVALLGAYHGINPSMGWLFAVALGMQEGRRSKVVAAFFPIGLGHLLSIAVIVALISTAQAVTAALPLRMIGAGILIAFGIFRFLWPRAHPRWVGMHVRMRELVLWSFLMASAHGAGLMLFPIMMDMPNPAIHHQWMAALGGHAPELLQDAGVVLLHTAAMVVVMGIIAIVVYNWVGLKILRSAWINLDTLWAGALVAAGVLALVI